MNGKVWAEGWAVRDQAGKIECIARGVTIIEGAVLLCINKDGGYAYLPGGHIDPGETGAEAVAREYLEETGLRVDVGPVLYAGEQLFRQPNRDGQLRARHEITVVYTVSIGASVDGDPPEVTSLEPDIAFAWVPLAAIMETDVRPESAKAWLIAGGRLGPDGAWITEDHRA